MRSAVIFYLAVLTIVSTALAEKANAQVVGDSAGPSTTEIPDDIVPQPGPVDAAPKAPPPPTPTPRKSETRDISPGPMHTEFAWVPLVGGDTDFGYGVGGMASLAGFEPGEEMFRYRLQVLALNLFKVSSDAKLLAPFQDYSLKAEFPRLLFDPLRLMMGLRYTRSSQLLYPGIGNAATIDPTRARDTMTYVRGDPKGYFGFGVRTDSGWGGRVIATYTRNIIRYEPGSTLDEDLRTGDALIRSSLKGADNHDVLTLEYALTYDTRNSEVEPTFGHYHEFTIQHSPRALPRLTLEWYRIHMVGRFYASLFDGRWAFALRLVQDYLLGDAPFYELARAGNRWALGSAFGVRGIPGQRYYGKYKVFGNFETRVDMFGLKFSDRKLRVGLALFADAGRVWSSARRRPDLDGVFWDFKYGLGGGLRLRQGNSFVVRADVAWSPWVNPISFYFGAGHMF